MLDPEVEMEDVERTFKMVGATDSLDEEQFWSWCTSLFGDFDDDEFVEQLQELIVVSRLASKNVPPPLPPPLPGAPEPAAAIEVPKLAAEGPFADEMSRDEKLKRMWYVNVARDHC